MKTTREIIKKVILEQLLKEEKIDLKIRANICIGSRAHFTLKSTELEYKNYISPIEKFMQEVKNEQTTI